jgi:hypothetical protein
MAQQVAWAVGKRGVEDVLLGNEADTSANFGQLGNARELSRQAHSSATQSQQRETAALHEAAAAVREARYKTGEPPVDEGITMTFRTAILRTLLGFIATYAAYLAPFVVLLFGIARMASSGSMRFSARGL